MHPEEVLDDIEKSMLDYARMICISPESLALVIKEALK